MRWSLKRPSPVKPFDHRFGARGDTALRADIRVMRRYGAPAQRVFDAWLDPVMARTWLFATASHPIARAEIDARAGGSFRFVDRNGRDEIEHTGEYLEIARPRRLAFTLVMEMSPEVVTRVVATIVPRKTGCELVLTHENVPANRARHIEGRWTGMLYGLAIALSSRFQSSSHAVHDKN